MPVVRQLPIDDGAMRIREATPQDIDSVVSFVQAMLHAMVSYGGHPLDDDDQIDQRFRVHFTQSLQREDRVFLVAVQAGEAENPVGIVEASIVEPHEVFQSKLVLHIHSIYVEPNHRREGIGQGLLRAVLEWGREKGCVEAELNTLVGNPARRLYERVGFEVFKLEMRLRL